MKAMHGLVALSLVLGSAACGGAPDGSDGADTASNENVGESEQEIRGAAINNTYMVTMARQPTGTEINYWNAQQDFSVNDVIKYHAQWLKSPSGAADRVGVINRLYQAAYRRAPSTCEFNYWNNYIQTTNTLPTYRNLAGYLVKYGQENHYPITGTFTYWDYGSAWGFYTNVRNTYSVPGC